MATAGQVAGKVAAAGFGDLLRANQAMVFSIAYHFLRDRALAEEIAQDVFLQLFRRLPKFESDAHVTFWLRRVTSHRCIDCARKRRFQAAVSLDDLPEPSISGEPADALMNRRLQRLIAALPEKPRMVMVLRYQEELLPEEIAAVMELPVRTVKSHLHRSLVLLRDRMQDQRKGGVGHGRF